MSDEEDRTVPTVKHSDIILMVTKRLDLVAEKMMRFEYDETMQRLMDEAAELFQYLESELETRNA